MSNILGRTEFFSETANLFTDEKTAQHRAKVIDLINKLSFADTEEKCDILVKIQETLTGACIDLLDEFLENIISLVAEPNADVKKIVIGFIEKICKQKPCFIPKIANVLPMLLRDSSAQVVKRVIQACGPIYKNSLQWICSGVETTDSVEQAWSALCLVKAQILDMIDNENDGVRTNVIKFLEGVVIIQTYPDEDSQKHSNDFSLENIPLTLKLIRRRKLEEEAQHIFDILVKFHGTIHISSVNLIACTGSLCIIAKLRPKLMEPVIKAMKSLNSNLPPTLTDSQVNSVRKNLKMQLMTLLKNRGAFEFQGILKSLLEDLGASQSEIAKAIPKMDREEQQRRQKRINENSTGNGQSSKKARLDDNLRGKKMILDIEELKNQRQKSIAINEKAIANSLKDENVCIELILEFIKYLPNEIGSFATSYTPPGDISIPKQIAMTSHLLAIQFTEKKLGPGAMAFSKDPPMRAVSEVLDMDMEDDTRKEEATKKLRETMERAKGEQELIQRMKQKAKTLKLQEVTKPLAPSIKSKFLIDSVSRILSSERQCLGVAAKRRKILTVMAATFPSNVRYFIIEFILNDLKSRIDLAFSWLFEEYCLLQGYTRHSFVKTENRPDFAYTELIEALVKGITDKCDFKEKIILLRRLYTEAPILPNSVIKMLVDLCKVNDDFSTISLDLLRDLAILRPPKAEIFVDILLTFSVHETSSFREKSLGNLKIVYVNQKVTCKKIKDFAVKWLNALDNESPPTFLYGEHYGRGTIDISWKDEITKICLGPVLVLMPYCDDLLLDLSKVYITVASEQKRTILRSIEPSIKLLGAENEKILRLIGECPKGNETLVTRIIHILTDRQPPTPQLVSIVRELHQTKVGDVRILIPVLGGLTKQEIIQALPKFLKLNPMVVKEFFNRLLGIGAEFANQEMPITPTEVLVALHTIDSTKCELKFTVKATSICLAEKEIYTQEVLGGCLQQMVDLTPTPTLLMRTVIQSFTMYPKLSLFVVNLLQRLILKQIWKQKVIWDGFLKCCQKLKPHSLSVLMQLPHPQLADSLKLCPDLRAPLLEYAQQIQENQMGHISQQMMDIITGTATDVFISDESGGYVKIDQIKKEIIDPNELTATPMDQPLPPGAE